MNIQTPVSLLPGLDPALERGFRLLIELVRDKGLAAQRMAELAEQADMTSNTIAALERRLEAEQALAAENKTLLIELRRERAELLTGREAFASEQKSWAELKLKQEAAIKAQQEDTARVHAAAEAREEAAGKMAAELDAKQAAWTALDAEINQRLRALEQQEAKARAFLEARLDGRKPA